MRSCWAIFKLGFIGEFDAFGGVVPEPPSTREVAAEGRRKEFPYGKSHQMGTPSTATRSPSLVEGG